MLKKLGWLWKQLKSKRVFALLFTLLIYLAVSWFSSEQGVFGILVLIWTLALQYALFVYHRYFSRSLSFEVMQPNSSQLKRKLFVGTARWLAFLPLLLFFGHLFAFAALVLVSAALAPSAWQLLNRLACRKQWMAKDLAKMEAYAPEVVFYVAGPSKAAYHINQWLPVAERLGIQACICIRKRSIFNRMDRTSLPVVYCRTPKDVEALYTLGVKTVLYPANPMQNLQSLRHFKLNHFFINHGESDKVVNQSKLLMAYDRLLVGGELAEQRLRLAGLPLREGQVVHVGRPQAELFLEQVDAARPIKTLLYAPTWEGFVDEADYSSIGEAGLALMQCLAKSGRYQVIVKPHPYVGLRLAERKQFLGEIERIAEQAGFEVMDAAAPVHEPMNRCDLMIADVGSVVSEFLFTNKPQLVFNKQGLPEKAFEALFPSTQAAYKFSSGEDALALLNTIEQEDTKAEIRQEVRRLTLGDPASSSLERFIKCIQTSLHETDATKEAFLCPKQ